MSFKNRIIKITGGLLLIAVLASCTAPTPMPTLTPVPTIDIVPTLNAVRTEAAQTVIADLTQNAPTATLTPTATTTSTPTTTPTRTSTLLPLWTRTPTQSALACQITSSSPARNTTYDANTDFDATWVIRNTGTEEWQQNDIDIRYSSGEKMHLGGDAFDLGSDVNVGDSYTLTLDMRTPGSSGTYSTTWTLNLGAQVVCSMGLTIVVR